MWVFVYRTVAVPVSASYTSDWCGGEMIAYSQNGLPFNSVTCTDMLDYIQEFPEDECAFYNSDDYLVTIRGENVCDFKFDSAASDCSHVFIRENAHSFSLLLQQKSLAEVTYVEIPTCLNIYLLCLKRI